MSRRHEAVVFGEATVILVCDECDKEEQHVVVLRQDDTCLEWAAVQQHEDWDYADDALVCSEECARKFWEAH